jgi:hypothetical protein
MTTSPRDPGRDAPDEPRDPHLLAALAHMPDHPDAPDAPAGPPLALTAALHKAAHDALAPAPKRPARVRWAWLDMWRQPVWATGLTAAVMAALVLGLWWQPRTDGPDGELPAIADARVASPAVSPAPPVVAQAAPASAAVTPSTPPATAAAPPPRPLAVPARPQARAESRAAPRDDQPPAPKAGAISPNPESPQATEQATEQAAAAARPGATTAPSPAVAAAPPPAEAPAPSPAAAVSPAPAAVAALAKPSRVRAPPPQLARLIDRLRETPDAMPASTAMQTDAVTAERKRAAGPAGVLAQVQGGASAWRWTPPGSRGEPVTAGSDAALWLQRLREAGAGRWQPRPSNADQADVSTRAPTVITFSGGSAGPIRITLGGDTVQWQDAEGTWWAVLPPGAADALRR